VHLALSREEGQEKQYVQDLMRKEREMLRDLLSQEKKGHIYLCGSTKMGQDVQALLKDMFGEEGFKRLEKEKRLIKELWG
jgi:sulfite reductase alpha subunit-like flavoprotein